MAKKTKARGVWVELIVRRGALRRYHKLKEQTAALPVKIAWDRRKGERRASSDRPESERRTSDRRQKPPFTWDVGDFVVVQKDAKQRKARKKK